MSLVKKRHLHKISNFNKAAYNFKDGHPMSDEELIKWMNEMYDYLMSGDDGVGNFASRACGSSLIIGHKVYQDDVSDAFDIEFQIIDGYKELTLFHMEQGEDFEWSNDPDSENKPVEFFRTNVEGEEVV